MSSSGPLLFNPSRASLEELEATLARRDLLERIEKDLLTDASRKSIRHWQIVGARGSGKSHLTELLARRLARRQGWAVARLPEQHYRITSLADLLEQICEHLEVDPAPSKERPEPERRQELALGSLNRFRAGGRQVLVILEELGAFLDRQVPAPRDQSRLRGILQRRSPFTLLTTSTRYLAATTRHDAPLYDFFQLRTMEDLSLEEVTELVKKRAEWDRDREILSSFEEVRSRLSAAYHFTGGNPRRVLALYSVMQMGVFRDFPDQLMSLLDEVTPFYQAQLMEISQQMRRILVEMALAERSLTPAMIARRCCFKTNQVTANVAKLKAEYVIRPAGRPDRRGRHYELIDRLFRRWIQMREAPANDRSLRSVSGFLHRWYTSQTSANDPEASSHDFWRDLVAGWQVDASGGDHQLEYLEEAYRGPLTYRLPIVGKGLKELASSQNAQPLALFRNRLIDSEEPSRRHEIAVIRSLAQRRRGRFHEALAVLEAELDTPERPMDAALERIRQTFLAHGSAAAADLAQRELDVFPGSPDVAALLAYYSLRAEKMSRAEQGLQQCIATLQDLEAIDGFALASVLGQLGAMPPAWRVLSGLPTPPEDPRIQLLAYMLKAKQSETPGLERLVDLLSSWPPSLPMPEWAFASAVRALVRVGTRASEVSRLLDHPAVRSHADAVTCSEELLAAWVQLADRDSTAAQEMCIKLCRYFPPYLLANTFARTAPGLVRSSEATVPAVLSVYSLLRDRLEEPLEIFDTICEVTEADPSRAIFVSLHAEEREAVGLFLPEVD